MSVKISDKIKPGVVTGDDVQYIFKIAKQEKFAIPAVNVVGSDSINAAMEAAKEVNSPIIIQFSNGGGRFFCRESYFQRKRKSCRGRKHCRGTTSSSTG